MVRFAAFSASLALLLLAACGNESDPSTAGSAGDAEQTTQPGARTFEPMATPAPGTIVYRVNAGGPAIASTNGPTWSQDTAGAPSPYGNASAAGSSVYSTTDTINMTDASLPAGTPMAVFQTERWDPPAGAEMAWHFPVSPGTYELRLYFAEIYPGAYYTGARVFDVYVEGQLRIDNLDVYKEAGAKKGIVKKLSVTADSSLDVEFRHQVENPEIKTIEIVYTGSGSSPPPSGSAPYRINPGGPGLTATDGGINWAADSAGSPSPNCNGLLTGNTTYATTHSISLSDPSVPAGTPQVLFQPERYDMPSSPDLQCDFAVAPGSYEVRLYLAEIYPGAMYAGARVFDVYVEGALVLPRVDVYAAVGGYKALVKKAVVTADSVLTVRFAHITENPAIKGIEIVAAGSAPPPPPPPPPSTGIRLNQFQVKATHNSYHLRPTVYDSPTWEYDMPTLTDQANLYGVRGFELDLHYSNGQFTVYHWAVDPNSTCPLLTQCLAELRAWSDAHPYAMPIFVYFDLKYDTDAPDNALNHLDQLDQTVDAYFPGSRTYRPDDLTGGSGQVQDAMRSKGWPTIDAVRGKAIFALQVGDDLGKRYANDGAGLQGKKVFVASGNTSLPWVVLALFDDTTLTRQAVVGGFIVKTRADNEPTMGNITQQRFNIVLASGAHLVATDYPVPHTLPGYDTTIPGGTPARCNPVTAPSTCTSGDIEK